MTDLSTAAGQASHYSEVSKRLNPRQPPAPKEGARKFVPFQTWPPRTPPAAKLPYVVGSREPAASLVPRHEIRVRDVIVITPSAVPLAQQTEALPVLPPALHWKAILAQVSKKHGVTISEIVGRQRSMHIVDARYEVMWRMKTETTLSLTQIGVRLGRDHSTVMHGVKKYAEKLKAAGL